MKKPVSLIGRSVKYAKFHATDTFLPGIGSLGSTLPPPNRTMDLHMVHTEEGLYVNINNSRIEAIVPWGNIQVVVYAPEDGASGTPLKVVTPGTLGGSSSTSAVKTSGVA